MEKSRFILKGQPQGRVKSQGTVSSLDAEVFFLKNTFVIQGPKIQKLSGDKLIKSDTKEIQEQLIENKNKETKIDFKSLETLKKIFGEFELTY